MSNTTSNKDSVGISINLFNTNNSLSNSNTTTTTVTTASSHSNNIPLVQLPVAAKASSAVPPTTLAIFQNVTNSKFLSEPIDKITKELSSVNTTNNNSSAILTTTTIPPTVSNLSTISYRFLFNYIILFHQTISCSEKH